MDSIFDKRLMDNASEPVFHTGDAALATIAANATWLGIGDGLRNTRRVEDHPQAFHEDSQCLIWHLDVVTGIGRHDVQHIAQRWVPLIHHAVAKRHGRRKRRRGGDTKAAPICKSNSERVHCKRKTNLHCVALYIAFNVQLEPCAHYQSSVGDARAPEKQTCLFDIGYQRRC